jgi:hypothetical protein
MIIRSEPILFVALAFQAISVSAADVSGKEVFYEGRIVNSSNCNLSAGDPRTCWKIAVKLQSGKILPDLRLYGFDSTISGPDKAVIYSTEALAAANVDIKSLPGRFYAAANLLRKGGLVRIDKPDCEIPDLAPTDHQCQIRSVQMK